MTNIFEMYGIGIRNKETQIFMSHISKLMWDFYFEYGAGVDPIVFFIDHAKNDCKGFWITPYNKGNLWKVYKDSKYYHLYYGTKRIHSTNDFTVCLAYIKRQEQLFETERLLWKY